MRICIDLVKCYKSGECYYNHPRLFKMGEDGFPALLIELPDAEADRLEARQAQEVCPAGAIEIESS